MSSNESNEGYEGPERIAVVGMACRFPGAENVDAFWRNLRAGVESITHYGEDELRAAGVPDEVLAQPDYVRSFGAIDGADRFDADFFEFTPRDAELTDPQHRMFLEQAWAALEDAGCDPSTYPGLIGVFAGCNMNAYLLHNVAAGGGRDVDVLTNRIRSDANFLATLASYKLDLRGPSFTVGTACSTSLVALHLAAQSLRDFQCDVALAGGVSLNAPLVGGYFGRDGLAAPDGHCRAFDARGQGTVPGSGVGVVVLKRLSDALADGDRVLAVVLGSAVNNDGSQKVGFTAPSVDGQMEVVAMAQAVAGVEPESITYIEAHGTGTSLGDPIEITALTRAFGTDARGYCAIGSVKSNVGHLDCAAGVAGVIKTVLALKAGEIPPSLHFEAPNPAIDFAGSPFFVADRLQPWTPAGFPRRAGVSALGVGGTNAHVILEEAPAPPAASAPADSDADVETLVLSARTPLALDRLSAALADHLSANPELRLADVAFTLQRGRRAFGHRRALAARDAAEAAALLRARRAPAVATLQAADTDPGVVFLFPGAGTERPGMARGPYVREPAFRAALDRCFTVLRARWGMDLRAALYGDRPELLRETAYADAAVFAVGWALAEAWRALGIEPRSVAGHGVGEIAAACTAGVFSLEGALELVVRRAKAVDALPETAARIVTLDVERVRVLAAELPGVWISAVNAAHSSVVCGTEAAMDALAARVRAEGGTSRMTAIRRPLHSAALAGIRDALAAAVSAAAPRPPALPLASGSTGEWLRPEEARSAAYWAEHLASPVLFGACVARVREGAEPVLLEMGAGQLCDWARLSGAPRATPSLAADADGDEAALGRALAYLWAAGVPVDWAKQPRGDRRRVALPGHPLDRRRYWIDAAADAAADRADEARRPASRWVHAPEWRQAATPPRPAADALAGRRFAVFAGPAGDGVVDGLRGLGADVVRVQPAAAYGEEGGAFAVRPGEREDFARLAAALRGGEGPVHTLHLWALEDEDASRDPALGAHALMHWIDAAATAGLLGEGASVTVATSGAQAVLGPELRHPARALLVGGVRGAAAERPGLHCRSVDVEAGPVPAALLLAEVADAVRAAPGGAEAAYRGRRRWTARLAEVAGEARADALRTGGAWLVTGGRSGIGRTIAGHLARRAGARLALLEPEAGDAEALVAELTALGAADVAVLAADVADAASLRAAIDQVRARFGALDGVVHAAGADGAAAGLPSLVGGALALDAALAAVPPDLLLLCRPLGGPADGRGIAEVHAAGALLDALAAQRADGRGLPTVSLAWGAAGASDAETAEVLDRLLSMDAHAQLAVSPRDPSAPAPAAAPAGKAARATGRGRHPRPPVATPFVAPRGELESTLTALFERELGIEPIGADDDFFEMGGDSLLAMQVMTAVNAEFALQIPLRALFEAPTPALLARMVVGHQAEGMDEDLLAAVLAEL
jgi:phthiocerol/phenolphthiocerol synthesis type-I polyketide synthase E